MHPVIQEEKSGCGIASVAVLTGLSYQKTKELAESLGIYASDKLLWSDTKYVCTLLRAFNMTTGKEQLFSSWEELPSVALLAIKWHMKNKKAFWHWVVFWRSPSGPVVFDSKKSLRNHIRTDFGRMKPQWFIPVYKVC